MVDARDNPRTQYLINGACVLAGREPKSAAMTNGVSGRGVVPIPLVSGSAMGTEAKLMEYPHWGKGCKDQRGIIVLEYLFSLCLQA